ncbi:uncharacterized protein LOC120196276 isoform X2 [Hibiscus syriacus]|uniref:uncharacterized protein LOC120196276 isoform X2 n=1 Tax=Hibiscus syriacus TaxID=106335 RepID=UPI001924C5DF|nr:uncharacterized protein LOC120196276 isoform X2 [Hibiscus syriacus]
MDWWLKVIFPVRRLWFAVSSRVKARKSGLLKLHDDVQTCGYEDVQVMWEMLRRSESEFMAANKNLKRKHRPTFRKVLVWSSSTHTSSFSSNHA